MRSSYQIFLMVFLVLLFRSSSGMNYSTEPNEIIGEIKKALIRKGYELMNGSEAEHNTNQTSIPIIPSDDIVGQIISFLNCGSFPTSPNSHLQYFLDHATKNLTLFQACNRYFKMTESPGSLRVQCEHSKWIFNKIHCERTTCPRLTAPPGGHISTDDNVYNTTVYFWCSAGFSINGTDKLFCEENGLWNSPPPTCIVSFCSSLSSPRHGFVSHLGETATNQTVEFSCQIAYSLIGDAVLRCQDDGRWNNTAPVCKKMCPVLNIENRSEGVRLVPGFRYLSIGALIQQGQRVIFTCKPGYTPLSVSGFSTCIAGQWRPPIRCRKACTAVKIANGEYILSKDSSTVEYSCLPGYQLVGQRKLSCTTRLRWDSEPPICTQMCTLPNQHQILSFRRKATYEIIPFGAQVVNGSQVYFVCRSKTVPEISVTKCLNGSLSPPPCRAGLVKNILRIHYHGEWREICESSDDVCSLFGYRQSHDKNRRCRQCYHFDLRAFSDSSEIVLHRYRYETECMTCLTR